MNEMKEIELFIVEDDFVFMNILCELIDTLSVQFQPKGIKINYNTFYSSKEAVVELNKNPKIILLDYFIINDEFETDSAIDFIKIFKQFNSEIDVIVVSGLDDDELISNLKKNGASEYIGKDPDSLQKLIPILSDIISKKYINSENH